MAINLTLIDNLSPEIVAMLQAFYSRNHRPIRERLETLGDTEEKIRSSLMEWYVNYGHKSIGQCSSTTYFIEGVSLLAAKSIQDSRLYNGQETSTRFINFVDQACMNPLSIDLQRKCLDFYDYAHKPLAQHLFAKYKDKLEGVSTEDAAKAIRARVFDILRAFLPAGVTTQLSWHSTLAHSRDRLVELSFHPLKEISLLSRGLIKASLEKYPTAFANIDAEIKALEQYYNDAGSDLFYYDPVASIRKTWPEFEYKNSYSKKHLLTSKGLNRPKGVAVPKYVSLLGQFEFKYTLDFGSFRDIQRHRDCIQPMPLLTTEMGFEKWYLEQLPEEVKTTALTLLSNIESELFKLGQEIPRSLLQYYIPIGYRVQCMLICDYRELVYISELRTSKSVHPTLRKVAHKMAECAKNMYLCPIHSDMDEEDFTVSRGKQDIIKK